MTIEEKRKELNWYCGSTSCDKCLLMCENHWSVPCDVTLCPSFDLSPEDELDEALEIIKHSKSVNSTNAVNHPSHYNKGSIEVWDFISDWKLNFDRGNAIKYLCRAGEKDPNAEIQDLEKAIAYINHEIKILKGEIENGTEED